MARRVNSKFLIVSSIVLLILVASGFIVAGPLKSWMRGDRSKKLIELADAQVKEADAADTAAVKREKLESAVRNYQMAVGADSKNPEIFLKLGDALSKMTSYEVGVYLPASLPT